MMRNLLFSASMLVALIGCKKNSPKPPEAVQLLFPEQNSECNTGEILNETTSQVTFSWSASNHTDSYELSVTNINTSISQRIATTSTSAQLPLVKGEPFSWVVVSKNSKVSQTASSAVWSFYNAGSRTTFAPFPATIIAPNSGERVFKDVNNDVLLSWSASDLDEDIERFEVLFSTENPPTQVLHSVSSAITSAKASVVSGNTYYWSVVVIDSEGNKSNSGVYSFSVL